MDKNNISEEISSHHNSVKGVDHACDENGKNLLNKEEKADITSINYINAANAISMNDYGNFIHKDYSPFLSSNNHEYVSSVSEYDSGKRIVCHNENKFSDLSLNKSKSFEWQVSLLFFSQRQEIFITYGSDYWQHINSSNHKIHSHDQMSKMITNLGGKKGENTLTLNPI